MKNNHLIRTLLILTAIILTSCKKEGYRVQDKLLGEWNIDLFQRSEIKADGSETITLNENNVGTWRFYESDREFERTQSIALYDFKYTGENPSEASGAAIFISEEGKRLIFPNFYCEGVGCDLAYTIQEFSGRKMIVENYQPADNSDQVVHKLKMELRKK